jgi:hypothetical protein
LTGAPIIQLCQMQALSASIRWTIPAHNVWLVNRGIKVPM